MSDLYNKSVPANAVITLADYATLRITRSQETPNKILLTTVKELSMDPRQHVTVVAYLTLDGTTALIQALAEALAVAPPQPTP